MNAVDGGTIVERLQSQRANLVDVLHQLEAAIKTFGGTITANGNGTPTNGKTIHWTQRPENKALLRKTTRKAARARRANKYAPYPTVAPAPVAGQPF